LGNIHRQFKRFALPIKYLYFLKNTILAFNGQFRNRSIIYMPYNPTEEEAGN